MALFKKPDAVMYCGPNGTNVLVLLSSTPNPVAVGVAVIPLAGDDQRLTDSTKPANVIHKCLDREAAEFSAAVKRIYPPREMRYRWEGHGSVQTYAPNHPPVIKRAMGFLVVAKNEA
jgi:hypothetical protein